MAKNAKRTKKDDGPGGTYVYDKERGRMVRVSDRIPKVSSKAGRSAQAPCGRPRSACGGGGCGSGG